MTLGDLTLGIILIVIVVHAFIGIKKLGFEKYSVGGTFGNWMGFWTKLIIFAIGVVYFSSKIDWSYKIF